ncbi:MAG: DUF349 domain-containing protein [Bacteroidales bacterium]|nr:DUF349 domain-containing protein [Bacteroidales bacterium]MBS3776525.1 DUF349 domain-containing protein [Bacteroidales bacterium]
MDSKENHKSSSEQNQPLNEQVESVTQNNTPQDQYDGDDKEDQEAVNQGENNYGEQESETDDGSQEPEQDFSDQRNASRDMPNIDYTTYTKQELVDRLKELVDSDNINNIRKEVDVIKATFYKKQRADNEENKTRHTSEGGDPESFVPEKDPQEEEMKELLRRFKQRKAEANKKIADEKKKNLEEKYKIIEELKNLVNKKESMNQTFKEFRELQKRWKDTGPVPQNKEKVLWATYHHHVEKFYDFVKINKELRDLDLKKNLEAKLDLCEKAEQLKEEDNIVEASKTLQDYHDQWREIGPVPYGKREEIWQRFKSATYEINKRHQEYFKELKRKENENLEAKRKICEQAEEIAEKEINTHKAWNRYTRQILDLQKEWRKIGFAPKKYNNKIFHRFRKACDRFFDRKREFYDQHREWQENNLKKKKELLARAEELKDSTDWINTKKELVRLQRQWKEIGPVPKNQADEIWNRFRGACDHFFQRKKQQEKTTDNDFEKNLELKEELIQKIRNFKPSDNMEEDIKQLQTFEDEWSHIGFVPYEQKDKIQEEYRKAIYNQYDNLNIDDIQKEVLKYRSKLKNLQQKPKAENRMYQERDKFMNKIEKLENNIHLWENNLGFISAESSEANSMINDYKKKIEHAKNEISVLEEKIKLIDTFDTEEE